MKQCCRISKQKMLQPSSHHITTTPPVNPEGTQDGTGFSLSSSHLDLQLEKAMAPHSSTLAWKIPWMEEPGGLQSMVLQSRAQLSNFTFTFHFDALEKEMATHSSVLAWRIPGMVEPGGLPCRTVGHD